MNHPRPAARRRQRLCALSWPWLMLMLLVSAESCATVGDHPQLIRPVRGVVRIAADDAGFHPNHLAVPRGHPLTLIITRRSKRACLHAVVVYVNDTRFVRELPYEKPVEILITPHIGQDAGFTCSTGMYGGKIQLD